MRFKLMIWQCRMVIVFTKRVQYTTLPLLQMQQRHQNQQAFDAGDWLRGLHELLPHYYSINMLCDLISLELSDNVKKDIRKIFRFSEERRADINTTVSSPYRYVPHLFASFGKEMKNISKVEEYLQFYYLGRITIPRITYEKFR